MKYRLLLLALLIGYIGICQNGVDILNKEKKRLDSIESWTKKNAPRWDVADRGNYLNKLNKDLRIDSQELKKRYDSIVVIHYKGTIYQLLKKGNNLTVVQVVMIEKKEANADAYKLLTKTDTVFKGNLHSSFINQVTFDFLFDMQHQTSNPYPLKNNSQYPATLLFKQLYWMSFSRKEYHFNELNLTSSTIYNADNISLEQIINTIFFKFHTGEKRESFIKSLGTGIYKHPNNSNVLFEYRKDKKFRYTNITPSIIEHIIEW
jgi:hypothetical protein